MTAKEKIRVLDTQIVSYHLWTDARIKKLVASFPFFACCISLLLSGFLGLFVSMVVIEKDTKSKVKVEDFDAKAKELATVALVEDRGRWRDEVEKARSYAEDHLKTIETRTQWINEVTPETYLTDSKFLKNGALWTHQVRKYGEDIPEFWELHPGVSFAFVLLLLAPVSMILYILYVKLSRLFRSLLLLKQLEKIRKLHPE